jgi:lipoate synthase
MNIVERENFSTVECNFVNEWLDLNLKECSKKIEEMFEPRFTEEPVVYVINFDGDEEELSWVIDLMLELAIDNITTEEAKFKDIRPHARYEVSNKIALNLTAQKQLINYKSVTRLFTIEIRLKDKTVYNMLGE